MKLGSVTLTQRTTTQRVTHTSDTGGGYTDIWNNVATSVPCRGYALRVMAAGVRGAIGGVEVITGERPGIRDVTAVLVPVGTDVQEGDRLLSITDRLGATIFTGPMMVSSVGEYPDHLRLTVRRIV